MRRRAIVGALVAGLLSAGCGGSGDDAGIRPPVATADLPPAESCRGASSADDPPGDSTGPFQDLRRLDLRVTRAGVCVRWTTERQALVGTTFVLGLHGPFRRIAGGGATSHGYGFDVALVRDGAEVTFGLADSIERTPNVLKARVGQSGRTVSAFVPRGELDRAPANMRDRPPFPYDAVIVEARVTDAATEDIADSWPDDGVRQAAYVDGELCGPPCSEPSGLFNIPR